MKPSFERHSTRALAGALLLLIPLLVYLLSPRSGGGPESVALAQGRTVSFTASAYSVNEDEGPATISVQISPAITDGTVVTVEYLTAPGTATPGSNGDYISASGTLTFTLSSATLNFDVIINDDSVNEPNETVNLILRNPTNAALGPRSTAVLTIVDDDPAPTSTPSPTTGAPPVFVDAYEPNNSLAEAFSIAADAPRTCNITLWPAGDEDFFRFVGKRGLSYRIFTSSLSAGLDTELFVYDTQGNQIGRNDDINTIGDRSSSVSISAGGDGFYYARVVNRDPSDPANKTYCIEVDEVVPFTPTPSATPVPGADECEFNSTLATACVLNVGADAGLTGMSFVPVLGSSQDTDFYKVWMRAGTFYVCETVVNQYADTNMIFLDLNGNDFQPNLGNNDKAPGDYGSRLSILAPYTGWLYVLIGPVVPPPYEESFLHTYDITCTGEVTTPTPPATVTSPPVVGPPAGGGAVSTPTPFPFPTFPATPTPFDLSFLTPVATPTPPLIQIQPLPTATPFGGGEQSVSINVTVYYDTNFNFLPELNEGIMDVAVALYDNASGALIAFGSTNEAGTVSFASVVVSGPVRVVIPYLNYSQVVIGGSSTIMVRVAPQPLPIGIP